MTLMSIKLFEFIPSRSARARWTLLELDLPYESIEGREVFGSDDLRKVHPLSKLPAMTCDGRPLFESAAICTWLADSYPDKKLVAPSGTWERALHDQWVAFTLSELEAYLWSTAQNTFVFAEDKRLSEIIPQNDAMAKRGLRVLDDHLADKDYLVGNSFSVTDIFAGFAVNWARRQQLTDEFEHVKRYNDRLFERPHCTLSKD